MASVARSLCLCFRWRWSAQRQWRYKNSLYYFCFFRNDNSANFLFFGIAEAEQILRFDSDQQNVTFSWNWLQKY